MQKIGENIQIRRTERIEVTGNGLVAAYIHTGGKVGVLVEVGADKEETANSDEFKQLVRDITLQIAAANPVCIRRDEVPPALVERERAIYAEQMPQGQTRTGHRERSSTARWSKFYAGVCLLEQAFVKNPDQTITQLVAEKARRSATPSRCAASSATRSARKSPGSSEARFVLGSTENPVGFVSKPRGSSFEPDAPSPLRHCA